MSTQTDNKNSDALQYILKRFHNHPSLIKIRQLVNNQTKSSFQPVTLQIPDSHCEKKNIQNEHIIAHFEYFFTCLYSKTVCLARREAQRDKNYSLFSHIRQKFFHFEKGLGIKDFFFFVSLRLPLFSPRYN